MSDIDLLVAAVRAGAEPSDPQYPAAAPRAGQAVDSWIAEVSELRAQADEGAIRHRANVDVACEELFGTRAAELVTRPEVELFRSEVLVQIPRSGGLRHVVPALPNSVPPEPAAIAGVPEREAIAVRVTSPPEPTAVVVRLHGGAFWMGGGSVSGIVDGLLIDHVAAIANAAVLDVDYRLAPEYPYPAPVNDVLAVLDAVRAGRFGAPAGPIALMGTSSGANSAVMVARVEALRGNAIAALGLVVPSVMLASGPQSAGSNPAAWEQRRALLSGYLGGLDPEDPWISPGLAGTLAGMPPTFAAVAEFDEVAAGGEELCAAIRAAGQEAEARVYPMTHVIAPPSAEAAFIRDLGKFFRIRLT